MSIVGTQSVSMSDLMKLGVPALNAMAQGQMKTIAPPYMVLAALKSLTEQQQGQAQAMPQGTIKDQVVAQSAPPQTAGIGAMAPQGFAEGGFVSRLPEESGLRKIIEWIQAGRPPMRRALLDSGPAQEEIRLPVTQPTAPPFEVPIPEISIEEPKTPPRYTGPIDGSTSVGGSRSVRSPVGIAAVGPNALEKYGPDTVQRQPRDLFQGFQSPENEALRKYAEKYEKPDEARMAELKAAERNAGLGAFAKAMMQGRGFGAAFGPAAAEYMEAKEARADKRRAYEDQREGVARELGIARGAEVAKRARELYDTQVAEQEKDYNEQVRSQGRTDSQVTERNRARLDLMRINAQLAAVRESATARRDGNILQRLTMISNGRAAAADRASKQILDYYEKLPMFAVDPNIQRRARSEANAAAAQAETDYMRSMKPILQQMGIEVE